MKCILIRIIDVMMLVLVLLLMAFYLTGQQTHEILGTVTLICFIIHHVLNWRWHQNILKGRYNAIRKVMAFINIILFIDILCLGISGMLMSDFVFSFVPSFGLISFARRIHMTASYWGFVLMFIHFGFHWQRLLSIIKKKLEGKSKYIQILVLKIFPILVCIAGLYFFIKNRIYSYLFSIESFVFFDYEVLFFEFICQYLLISGLFIALGYMTIKKLTKKKRN